MEQLDYYDQDGNYLGVEPRDKIHADGLWHKTVHCWLYDSAGNVYFQLREDAWGNHNKMYTTASGHVKTGETVRQAFVREMKEEIGIEIDVAAPKYIMTMAWSLDMPQKDGGIMRDRALANIYASCIGKKPPLFAFTDGEVEGIIKVNAKKALQLLRKETGKVRATRIDKNNNFEKVEIGMKDFLINPTEIGIVKYGKVLQVITTATTQPYTSRLKEKTVI